MEMLQYIPIVLVTVVANFIIAYVVYRKDPQSATHRLLATLAVITILWTVFNYLALSPGPAETRLFFVRAVMFFTTPYGTVIMLLSLAYPRPKLNLKRYVSGLLVLFNIIVALLAISPYMFTRLENLPNGGFNLYPGLGIIAYAIGFMGFMTYGFIVLVKKYRKSEGLEKKQLKFLIYGIIISFTLLTLTNFIAVIIFGTIQLTNLGPPFTLIMFGFTTYAIVKHKLLNIKVLATQIFVIVILLILLGRVFAFTSVSGLLVDASIFVIILIFSVLLVRSVTKEVEQKEKLAELNKKLKDLDAQKDEFISMAAHELRAPMTAIKGYVSMILEGDVGDIPEKARRYLADANNINERLIRLVNNMLNVSRIEEGRMVYQLEEENLSNIVRTVFSQFAPEAERKGLKYVSEIPSHIKDRVRVDPDRIQEVVGNFLSNAVKYTNEGTVKVRLVQPSEGVVRCEVIDSGPGISKEEQAKLFQKFYRVESNVGKTTGTGLGLYISRLLIEKFGGEIGLESGIDKGSTFWFELPLATSKRE